MGKTQGEKEMRSIDRRSFFKLGGLTAGAAALTGGMLAGCAPQSQTDMAATGGENETVDAAVPYAVQAMAPALRCRRHVRPVRTCW